MKKYHKSQLVNLIRVVYIPLLVTTFLIILLSIFSITIHRNNLQEQYKTQGIQLASLMSNQISESIRAQEYTESNLEDRIIIAAKVVLEMYESDLVTNESLIYMLDVLEVTELHYMDRKGKILYSTIEGYLGWIPHPEHPLYDFVRSSELEMIEAVRPDDKYNKLMKFGAVKSNNGSFVQVGIDAELVQKAKNKFSYQSLIDEYSKHSEIINVTYLDLESNVIATSDNSIEIGDRIDLEPNLLEINEAGSLNKASFMSKNNSSFEFILPVYNGADPIGRLNIKFSLEALEGFNRISLIGHFLLIFIVIINLIWFQFNNVISPIYELESGIKKIDVNNNIDYIIPEQSSKAFSGIVKIINKILEETYTFIHKLKSTSKRLEASNEELSTAYQQLAASEEVLKEQYAEIVQQKQKIEHIAYHDDLTGLPNRQGFLNLVKEKLLLDVTGAVILIDIDNFKGVNDTLGHDFGDRILLKVTDILNEYSHSDVILSRFSGDEFLLYFSNYNSLENIERYLTLVKSKIRKNLNVEGKDVYITSSIGISIYPEDGHTIQKLIMNADSAMYKVKEKGKNGHLFFDQAMVDALKNRKSIELAIREAIDKNLFRLVYQPQVSLTTGDTIGFEALLRMGNDMYSPSVFIPVSEELGSIVVIGRWVAKTVIEQLAKWQSMGVRVKPVAINFSTRQLVDKEFHSYIKALLEENNVSSRLIEIEITESILIKNMEEALDYLEGFKSNGICISLDDFGTGFSSLRYLSTLPIQKVKLDKSMINRFMKEGNERIIKSIAQLASCFNLSVLAEGVEDLETTLALKKCGCDTVQGYYFSKPKEANQIINIMGKNYKEGSGK